MSTVFLISKQFTLMGHLAVTINNLFHQPGYFQAILIGIFFSSMNQMFFVFKLLRCAKMDVWDEEVSLAKICGGRAVI